MQESSKLMHLDEALEKLKKAGMITEVRTQRDNNAIEYLKSAKADLDTCTVWVAKASGEYDGQEPVLRNLYEKLRQQYGMIDYIIEQIKKTR